MSESTNCKHTDLEQSEIFLDTCPICQQARIDALEKVVEEARKWMNNVNPTCEESFYQEDNVNQELPELGIAIFNALIALDQLKKDL